jgi:hypothetical protein
MRTLRRVLGSRANAVAMAVLALALQAGSNGYVQACPMKLSATSSMSATHSCCHACQHGTKAPTRKACCFLGVMSPCADGVVSEARVTRPTTQLVAVAAAPVVNAAWATLTVPVSTAAPPIPTVSPPRTTVLLI